MRHLKVLLWIAVPLLLGTATYAIRSVDFKRQWAIWMASKPVIEFPAFIDLGEQEHRQIAFARFTIANRGGSELIIDDVRTNCACSGLEREEEGKYVRLSAMRLGSGEQADVVITNFCSGKSRRRDE